MINVLELVAFLFCCCNPSGLQHYMHKQTVLQDYKELSCPLSELPVNEYTAGELVRLCMRPQDAGDDSDGEHEEDGSGNDEVVSY